MDPRSAAGLAFRLLAVFIAVRGATILVQLVEAPFFATRFTLVVALQGVVNIGAGALLWSGADRFAGQLPDEPFSATDDRANLARTGVALVGLVFAVLGAVEVVSWLALQGSLQGSATDIASARGIVPPLVKAGIGVALVVGASSVASLFGDDTPRDGAIGPSDSTPT